MEFLGDIFEDIFDPDRRNRRGRYNNQKDYHGDHHDGHHRDHDDHHYRDQRYNQHLDSGDIAYAIGAMVTPRCQNCGRVEKPGTRFCGNCGTPLAAAGAAFRRCPHCTGKLKDNDRFCPSCGANC